MKKDRQAELRKDLDALIAKHEATAEQGKPTVEVVGSYIIETGGNGKRLYKWRDGAKLDTYDMDLFDFINYCLFPIDDFAQLLAESGDEPPPEAIVIERLYAGAMTKVEQMIEELERRTGTFKIIMVRCPGNDFLREKIIDVVRTAKE
jgi:hypothetical protein